jgi:nitroreductase
MLQQIMFLHIFVKSKTIKILITMDTKAQLYDLAHRQDKVKEASVVLIVVGNKAGYTNANPVWDEMLASVGGNQQMVDGAKQAAAYLYGSSDERKLKFAESNASLLAMALMIAAKEYGVDSHPMSGLDFDGIHQQFHLLPDEVVVMTICLGFADETKKLFDRRPRRSFDQICSVI